MHYYTNCGTSPTHGHHFLAFWSTAFFTVSNAPRPNGWYLVKQISSMTLGWKDFPVATTWVTPSSSIVSTLIPSAGNTGLLSCRDIFNCSFNHGNCTFKHGNCAIIVTILSAQLPLWDGFARATTELHCAFIIIDKRRNVSCAGTISSWKWENPVSFQACRILCTIQKMALCNFRTLRRLTVWIKAENDFLVNNVPSVNYTGPPFILIDIQSYCAYRTILNIRKVKNTNYLRTQVMYCMRVRILHRKSKMGIISSRTFLNKPLACGLPIRCI